MPLYEYQCRGCGSLTEVMQRFSDPPLSTCDDCGGELKKLISAPAFQFKGEGWYVTDYARKNNEKTGGKEAKDDGGGKEAKAGAGKKAEDAGGKEGKAAAGKTAEKGSAKGSPPPAGAS